MIGALGVSKFVKLPIVAASVALGALAGSAGCASGPKIVPVAAPGGAQGPVEDSAGVKKWAASFRTPNLCETAARREAVREPASAFRLLQACSRRSDFDVLEPLLRRPWLPLIKQADVTGLDILVRAMVQRGEFSNDAGSCRAAGIELTAVDSDVSLTEPGSGYVVVAGLVKEVGRTVEMVELSYELPGYSARGLRGGARTTTKYRYDDYGRVTNKTTTVWKDPSVRARHLQAWYATKRRLRFDAHPRCRVRKDDKRVVLGRIIRAQPQQPQPEGRNPIPEEGWLSVVSCYPLEVEVQTK